MLTTIWFLRIFLEVVIIGKAPLTPEFLPSLYPIKGMGNTMAQGVTFSFGGWNKKGIERISKTARVSGQSTACSDDP